MKKKRVSHTYKEFDTYGIIPVSDLKKILEEIPEDANAYMHIPIDYDGDSTISITGERDETDEEYQARLKKQAAGRKGGKQKAANTKLKFGQFVCPRCGYTCGLTPTLVADHLMICIG